MDSSKIILTAFAICVMVSDGIAVVSNIAEYKSKYIIDFSKKS